MKAQISYNDFIDNWELDNIFVLRSTEKYVPEHLLFEHLLEQTVLHNTIKLAKFADN